MGGLSRRDFIKVGALASVAGTFARLLAACGIRAAPPAQPSALPSAAPAAVETATPSQVPATTEAPAATETPAATATQLNPPDLAVAHGNEPEQLVRTVIAALGGMARFVPQGANVVIKPNICVAYHTYEFAATSNPWVVGALVKLCLEAGAGSVKVMDYGFGGTQKAGYAISGIQEQVEAAGGTMVLTPSFAFKQTPFPNGTRLTEARVMEDVLKADVLINVPIAKVHGLSRLTLGMKNLMGVVLDRPTLHWNLSENLVDLADFLRPELTVLDAVRIMVANGPTGGSLDDVKALDTVVASPDIVAVDAYGATLFGLQPDDLEYVVQAAARGLGQKDLQNLRIEEMQVG